jgi:BirA family transcriptional regulator, biotin operon repressor / biotin---[acetyl-CoA-carboxylase] ligase
MKPPPATSPAPPAPLSEESIQKELKTGRFGRTLYCFPVVDSTNETLRGLAGRGAEEGTAVVAETQLRGRGRRGRQWFSPAGEGIFLSLLLRPRLPLAKCSGITILAAAAVSWAIEDQTGLRTEVKWPNDILLGSRKVGGILAETGRDGTGERYLVLGIGINVRGESFPPELEDRAVSLRMAGAGNPDRPGLIAAILGRLEELYRDFLGSGDISPALDFCRDRSATLGRRVRAVGPGGEISGLALDLTEEGGLRLRRDNGEELVVTSGEVTLSPAG